MDLSIIIINWNSKDFVRGCLRSIFQYPPIARFEVLVLDSGSNDGCGEMIARDFPDVRFFQSPENLGFARANNLAVSHAQGDTFFFLNPDTETSDGAITALYTAARETSTSGVVGARLLNTDGTLQTSCVQAFPTILNQILISDVLIRCFPKSVIWGKAALFKGGTEPIEVEAVSGAALMIPREVFRHIGGFCEKYFMYSEDIDLCYKARKAGFRNRHHPSAEIVHHGGGSSNRQPSKFAAVMKVEATYQYMLMHQGWAYAALYRCSAAGAAILRVGMLSVLSTFPTSTGMSSRAALARWKWVFLWVVGCVRSSHLTNRPKNGAEKTA